MILKKILSEIEIEDIFIVILIEETYERTVI